MFTRGGGAKTVNMLLFELFEKHSFTVLLIFSFFLFELFLLFVFILCETIIFGLCEFKLISDNSVYVFSSSSFIFLRKSHC